MSIRHCKNATTYQQKRQVRRETRETVAVGPVVSYEINDNLVGFVGGSGHVYAGFDHIPVGTDQYDENPIPE